MATEHTVTVEYDSQEFELVIEHQAYEAPSDCPGTPESHDLLEARVGGVDIGRFLDRGVKAALEKLAVAELQKPSDDGAPIDQHAANSPFFAHAGAITGMHSRSRF